MDGRENSIPPPPPSPHAQFAIGYNEKKKRIIFCFQKSFSKTQINMKMQKRTFPAQNVIVTYLKKERSHENNPCFLEDYLS